MLRLITQLGPLCPAEGLAHDEALLEGVRLGRPDTVRFWVNDRAVVIGRSQAAADEVDLDRAAALRVPVLRRISGGGAVVHYPGNLNLSLLMGDARGLGGVRHTFEAVGEAIAAGLIDLGIRPVVEGNRLLFDGRKVGGAAQARRGGALLYHTTLLLLPDRLPMETLLRALRPGYAPARMASRPHPTASLHELGFPMQPADLVRCLAEPIAGHLGQRLAEERLTEEETERAEVLAVEKYGSGRWNLSP